MKVLSTFIQLTRKGPSEGLRAPELPGVNPRGRQVDTHISKIVQLTLQGKKENVKPSRRTHIVNGSANFFHFYNHFYTLKM